MDDSKLIADEVIQGVSEGVAKALDLVRGSPDQSLHSIVLQVNVKVVVNRRTFIRQGDVMGDTINVSHVQNSIVNIKGTLQGASVAIGAAPIDSSKKDELKSLLAQLEAALTKEAGDKPESTEAISDAAKETMEKVSKDKPNKRSIESATKGFLDLAKDVAEALPVATKIASLIAGMFGFTL